MSCINSEFPIYCLPNELLYSYLDVHNFWVLLQTCKSLYTRFQDVETNNSKKVAFLEIFHSYFPKILKHVTLKDFNIYYEKMRQIVQLEVYYRLRERCNCLAGIYAMSMDTRLSSWPGSSQFNLQNVFDSQIKGEHRQIVFADLPKLVSNRIIHDGLIFELFDKKDGGNFELRIKEASTEKDILSYPLERSDLVGFALLEDRRFFLLSKDGCMSFLDFNVSDDVVYLHKYYRENNNYKLLITLPQCIKRKICKNLPDYQNDSEESLNNQITNICKQCIRNSKYIEIEKKLEEISRTINGALDHKVDMPESIRSSNLTVRLQYLEEQKEKLTQEKELIATHRLYQSIRKKAIEDFCYVEQVKEINRLREEQNDVYGQMYGFFRKESGSCLRFGEFAFHGKYGFDSDHGTRAKAISQCKVNNQKLLEQFNELSIKDQNLVYEKLHFLIDPANTHIRHGELTFHCVEGFSSSYFQRTQAIEQRLFELPAEELNSLPEEGKNCVYAELHELLNRYNICPQHGEFAFHCLHGFSSTVEQRYLALEIFYNKTKP